MKRQIVSIALALVLSVFPFTRIARAEDAAQSDGVWTWGGVEFGYQGSTTFDAGETPLPVHDLSGVIAVSGGLEYSLALKSDGAVWGWGTNDAGQVGDGTTSGKSDPVSSKGLTGIVAISAGHKHGLALKADGTVWSWGDNSFGQLGAERTAVDPTPAPVSGLSNVAFIAAGPTFSIAVKSDGTVWTWGDNTFGQLGKPGAGGAAPTPIAGLSGIVGIAAGYRHGVALKYDGTVWAWGSNDSGELGVGDFTERSGPVLVSGVSGATAVAAGLDFSLALKSDGTVWAWGNDDFGQLGSGVQASRSTAAPVADLEGVRSISASMDYGLAVKSGGEIWTWGADNTRLRTANPPTMPTPLRVGCFTDIVAVSAGPSQSMTVADAQPKVDVTPASLDFGPQLVGDPGAVRAITLTNRGRSPVFLDQLAIVGSDPGDFAIVGSTFPSNGLCPGESCTLSLVFAPSAGGPRQAALTFTENSVDIPITVPITGGGLTPVAQLDRQAIDFGGVAIGGGVASQTITVNNSGTGPLVIRGVDIGGDAGAEFAIAPGALPLTVPAGGSAALTFQFAPSTLGTRTAVLSLTDNATDSPQAVALTGLGVMQIAPGPVGLSGGQTQTFAVDPVMQVTWSVQGDGTVDSDGTYHAPASVTSDEKVVVTATSDDGSLNNSVVVSLWAPLLIVPASATLHEGDSLALSVNLNVPVQWSVDGGDANGTIDPAGGVFHAPPALRGDWQTTVRATAIDGSGRIAELAIVLKGPEFGDLNGDGRVNVEDAVLLLRALVGADTLTPKQREIADLIGDGRLDVRDVVALLWKAVGL